MQIYIALIQHKTYVGWFKWIVWDEYVMIREPNVHEAVKTLREWFPKKRIHSPRIVDIKRVQ